MLAVQIVDIVVLGLFSPVILNSQTHFRLLTGVPSTLNAVSQVSVMIFMGELVDFPALEFSGKTKTCWCESGGGPQKMTRGMECFSCAERLRSWSCSTWKRLQGDLIEAFEYREGQLQVSLICNVHLHFSVI